MKKLPLFLTALLLLTACDTPATGSEPIWQMGYGARELIPEDLESTTYYIAGYKNDNPAVGVLDYQCVKAVYMAADGEALLLIVVDGVGLSSGQVETIRQALPRHLRKIAHVVSTHTHAGIDTLGLWGPVAVDGKNETVSQQIVEKAAEAAEQAYKSRTLGRLYYGSATEGIENLQHDSRAPYVYDKDIHQLRFDPLDGGSGIRILNYAAHAESLRSENALISADFPRYLCDAIKRESGDDALFLPAAIGGLIMTRRLTNEQGSEYPVTENVVKTGELLASAVLSITEERELPPALRCLTKTVTIPLDNPVFIALGALGILQNKVVTNGADTYGLSVTTSVSLLRLGDLTVIGLPGELFPELAYGTGDALGVSASLQETLGKDFLVIGLFDDEIGYIVPPSDFLVHETEPYVSTVKDETGENHYEETNSVGPEAAEQLLNAIRHLKEALS
jgi:hypothetical protein